MGQSVNVLLSIYKTHTVPQRALDCRPDYGGLTYCMAKGCHMFIIRHIACGSIIFFN